MVYTSRSELSAEVDQLGNRTTYTYDELGRRATRKFPSGRPLRGPFCVSPNCR
ncbi:MAG: RHS repeat protein [Armatimonadetes bacterium]|nr:RHS repeat protein [Armatimonadota bacterium]